MKMRFFAQPLFLYFIVPLLTVVFNIFIKATSQNDRFMDFKKEDFAVGLELAVTGLIIFVTESANLTRKFLMSEGEEYLKISNKLEAVPWLILGYIMGIWAMSAIIRWLGWKEKDDLKIVWGIVIPDLIGIFFLIISVNGLG